MKLKVTSFINKDTGTPYLVYSNKKLQEEGTVIGSSSYLYMGNLYPYVVAGNGVGMAVVDDEDDERHVEVFNKI